MTIYQTQWDLAPATSTGPKLFRKQVLRKGTINYEGQKITFDDDFLKNVVKSFKSGAYDQVPFQFADEQNRHNMDPEKFRGEVKGLELTPDGVDMIVEPTPEGAELIKKNPRLGVSARIVTDLSKSDGRRYPVAIQHVLATMDPRLTGMRPWESVDLSEEEDEDDEVIDLTAAGLKKGTHVGTKTRKTKAAAPQVVQIDLSALPDSAFKDLLLAAVDEAEADTDTEEVTRTTRETVKRKTPKQRRSTEVIDEDDLDDEDVEDDDEPEDEDEVLDSDEDGPEDDEDEDDEEGEEDDEPPVSKKKGKKKNVKLSEPVRKVRVSKARRLELQLAERDWDAKKGDYVRAGVPPFLVDLATPIMSTPDKLVIDLSETGEKDVDAKKVIAGLLDGVKGLIDLAPEMGHGIDRIPDDKNDPTRQKLDQWDAEYGKP